MPLDATGDGLGMGPRAGEPQSSMIPGMAAPLPRPPAPAQASPLGLIVTPFAIIPPVFPDTSIQAPQPPGLTLMQPPRWMYDFDPGDGLARATFPGEIVYSGSGGAVTSFNTRSGAVVLLAADVTGVGGALLASPVFTGDPQAPTAGAADNDSSIATTAMVQAAIAAAQAARVGHVTADTGTFSNVVSTNNLITNYTLVSGNTGAWLNLVSGRYTPPAGRFFILMSMSLQAPSAGNGTATLAARKNATVIGAGGAAVIGSGSNLFSIPLTLGVYVDANGTDIFDFVVNPTAAGMNPQGTCTFVAFPI